MNALTPTGLNVWGVADGAAWQHVLPGCRSVLVIGSGGTALWDGFVAWLRERPDRAGLAAPLDQRVDDAIGALPTHEGRRWVCCAGDDGARLDFRTLALQAGLGHASRLGLLLHPTYGPWLGLRAACFTTDALPVTGPLATPPSCEGCPAPCTPACPVGAISPEGWAYAPCVSFQQRDPTCHGGCLARVACVVGTSHAYGPVQNRYHQHPASRPALLARLSAAAPAPDRSS